MLQHVVPCTLVVYELGWHVDLLQIIRTVRFQPGSVYQVEKMYIIYIMNVTYAMTFKFRGRKSWNEKEWKMNSGKMLLLIPSLFLSVSNIISCKLFYSSGWSSWIIPQLAILSSPSLPPETQIKHSINAWWEVCTLFYFNFIINPILYYYACVHR